MREAYQIISIANIDATLSHWPIYDANDQIKSQALRLITGSADQLFYGLIDDLQASFNKACGAGGSSLERSRTESAGGTTTIGGRHYTIGIKDGVDDPAKKPEADPHKTDSKSNLQQTPETIATYFQANNSVVESILDGLLGADQLGSASPIEGRAGVIAQGVRDGAIDSSDVGMEAGKGMTSAQAKEVIRLTEQYLGQGQYQAIKIFAAQLVGGAAGGVLLGGAAKGAESLLIKAAGMTNGALGGGRLSALLMAVKESIMRPMMVGGETGSISFGAFYKTTKDATFAANELGFTRVVETVQSQAVFSNGKVFITRDVTGHNGGVWKMVKTIRDLGQKTSRMGTYDEFLNWIGN